MILKAAVHGNLLQGGEMVLVAVDKKGGFGAAKIGRSGFPYAVRNTDVDEVRESR